MLTDLITQLRVIETLNQYTFSIGILNVDRNRLVPVKTMDLGGNISSAEIPLDDAAYLVETGSINFPARPVIDYIYRKIDYQLSKELNLICDNVFDKNWDAANIGAELREWTNRINTQISTYIKEFRQEMLPLDYSGQSMMIDPSILAKYIHCSILEK